MSTTTLTQITPDVSVEDLPDITEVQAAAPLTTAERNTLLAQAALAERKPTVPASSGVGESRAWSLGGQVD